ncbi:tetratricopeptide repeat protein [Pelovirga terrestris]|uniref:Tetratricopeptide repeat protein n=1 Tax=Pelovirga terrestris TaxID=2771352 RepID=A0A8J6QTD6_9BACT|nr:tetratricopeptide repeat protein [Pelovirga terrestris]MBD1399200.1 tetratricopeptide repeat protein [Pelovirga terrestris]
MAKFLTGFFFLGLIILGGCAGTTANIDKDRHQADVHHKLAEAHLQGNNPSAALRELLKAVELDSDNAAIRASLAQAYQERRAYKEAEHHYLEAIRLSKGDPRYENNLANLYLVTEEWNKAINYFDRAAKNLLFDSTHIAMTGKGYAFLQQGDYASALQAFREAVLMMANFAPAHYYQAEVYRLTEEVLLEKAALRRTIELAPELVQARYRLAVLLLRDGNYSGARQQLEIIINFVPDSEEGTMAAELIKTLPKE